MVRSRSPLILASVVAAAAFSLLATGCGGGSPRVANIASSTTAATTTTQNATQLVAFSRCMRSNGVPNFPDPRRVGGRSLKLTVHRLAASNPRFPAAMRACGHLLPTGGGGPDETAQQIRTRRADGLSFARCMRSHGVTRFPDPTAQGDLSVEMVQAHGVDVHSPAVLRVVQACLPASHGGLTARGVREALGHAGG